MTTRLEAMTQRERAAMNDLRQPSALKDVPSLTTDGTQCHAGFDGDCIWEGCPQLRDGEPTRSGRSLPVRQDRRGLLNGESREAMRLRLPAVLLRDSPGGRGVATCICHNLPPVDCPFIRSIEDLERERDALKIAGKKALSALDELLGDSDLDGDDSPAFRACQELALVLYPKRWKR